ncbi:MAG: tRNA dihydrouridine synthase DusB [Fidelibacterota bacterium]|nr:MAG: tRNA dihydrouridine synthase DusB [Candidatus Neomarinimicrobiota bacterium]
MQIGNLHLDHPVFLAPMAGVTDHPFRVLCRRFGAGLVYTEFVSANGVIRESAKTLDLVRFTPEERPIGIQLFGEEPETIAQSAAALAERFQPDLIDLNFGCPVPKVTRKGAGSAMLRDLELMRAVMEATVKAVPQLPVTVKMRAGWDRSCIVATEAAVIIEEAGGAAIALHPRTTKQQFTGRAEWSLIKAVKERVSIPVIGNGDIFAPEDALRMFEETGCDAVMVARGALGSPWLFRQIRELREGKSPTEVTLGDIARVCGEHFKLMLADKSPQAAVNYTKKHFSHYLKGFPGAVKWRKGFMDCRSTDEIARLLEEFTHFAESSTDGAHAELAAEKEPVTS